MNGYTLIDPPVSPFSPLSELLGWVNRCRDELEKDPGNPHWERALDQAEKWLSWAKERKSSRTMLES